MKKLLAMLISLLVLSTPVMAVESLPNPGILPDSPIYGLKRAFESIETALAFSNEAKAKVALKHAEKRLAEAKAMVEKDKPEFVEELVKEYEKNMNETNINTEKAVALGKNVTALVEHVASKTSIHLEILEEVYEKVPEKAKPGLLRAINASSKVTVEIVSRIENGEKYRERIKQEIIEKGIDKGSIKSAIDNIVEDSIPATSELEEIGQNQAQNLEQVGKQVENIASKQQEPDIERAKNVGRVGG